MFGQQILVWVDGLAAESPSKQSVKNDAKWRKRALDAIIMRSMHDLLVCCLEGYVKSV